MPQIVVRIDASLAADLDALVEDGTVPTRSQGVRIALEQFVDEHRRAEIGRQIVEGYLRMPQTEDEIAWADEQTDAMIEEEPW
jgi:metal-responsive CopG/Arc/MetJ family transcriptional regulator